MWPRKSIDISFVRLTKALGSCVFVKDEKKERANLESYWGDNALACLSVRSGFDSLLTALNFDPGSEIIMSDFTIPDMLKIVDEHDLVARGARLENVFPTVESLSELINENTKAVLVAHLFGELHELNEIADLCKSHDLLLIEDCAQAYRGNGFKGSGGADVSMFSFGPIKTNTSLAGAMLNFAQPELSSKVRLVQESFPIQQNRVYLKRVIKYLLLKFLSIPFVYGLFVKLLKLLKFDYDKIIANSVKGFPGSDFFKKIRFRPSSALLRTLLDGLESFSQKNSNKKIELSKAFIQKSNFIPINSHMSSKYWVFPIEVSDSESLASYLQSMSIDATTISGLVSVSGVPTYNSYVLNNLVFLPFNAKMSITEICKIADYCNEFALERSTNA